MALVATPEGVVVGVGAVVVPLVVGTGVVAVTPVPQEPPAALRDTQRTASVRRLSTNSCASERVLVETVFSTRLR